MACWRGRRAGHHREAADAQHRRIGIFGSLRSADRKPAHHGHARDFHAHTDGHEDLDAAHHGEDLDLRHAGTELGLTQVELSTAEGQTLMKMGRVLYPHKKLADAVYALLAKDLDGKLVYREIHDHGLVDRRFVNADGDHVIIPVGHEEGVT